MHLLWEISLDKVRSWKPFYRAKQQRGMGFQFPLDMKPGEKNRNGYGQLFSTGTVKLGYEVYAEGLTRVLRICEFSDSHKGDKMLYSSSKMRFRISYFALQLLEFAKKVNLRYLIVYVIIFYATFNLLLLNCLTCSYMIFHESNSS